MRTPPKKCHKKVFMYEESYTILKELLAHVNLEQRLSAKAIKNRGIVFFRGHLHLINTWCTFTDEQRQYFIGNYNILE